MSNEEQQIVPASALAEVVEIAAYRNDIEEWMGEAPVAAIRAALEAVKGVSIAACAEGPEAGVEAVKAAKKSLADARLRNATDNQKRFKSPVNAIGKRIDARNRELLAMIEPREAELQHELDEYAALQERLRREDEERRKAKTNARLQEAMRLGIVVDSVDAEQMGDEEWVAHRDALVEEKKERDSEEEKRRRAQDEARERIVKRMELAGKLGAHLSREDAEYLTEEEFESLADGWRSDKEARDQALAQALEVKNFKDRAAAQGFLLVDQDIAEWSDREAGFMLWMAGKVKERQQAQAEATKQKRLLDRSALLKDGETVSVKVLMEATDEEWSVIYGSIRKDREAQAAPVVAPAPEDPIPSASSNKQEMEAICKDFASFGRSLPTEELKAALRPVYHRMKQLAEKL